MIVKTKNKKTFVNAKLIIALFLISLIPFGVGYVFGSAKAISWCADFGLRFLNVDPIIDKPLLEHAIRQYKSSLGGWAFNETSPWYLCEGNNSTCGT